jgi:glycine cleavage system H lipoate-binding protein/ABC-type phosphate transport system substrate-binding protein
MKRFNILLVSLSLISYSNLNCKASVAFSNQDSRDSMQVMSTPELYNLSIKWASEYTRIFPERKIKVISVSNREIADNLIENGNIGFVSDDYYSGVESESIWKIVVGRDVIVPVINSNNPLLEEIYQHGISSEVFVDFLNNRDVGKWGTLLAGQQNLQANYYWVNDDSITKRLSEFLKTDKIKTKGIEVRSSNELISAIQKDPYAIGFCKMVNILDFRNQSIIENIKLLPIDRNGNGTVDYSEKIYDDFNVFSRGVWIGKYPKTLYSNIYSVSSNQPGNEPEKAFLNWVLTDGQQFLYSNGYSDLLVSERQSTADKLYNAKIYTGANIAEKSFLKLLLFIIGAIILTGVITNAVARYLRRKKVVVKISGSISHPVLNENSVIIPAGIYFDKTHTWAFMEQNGIVKVGVDDFLQHITGPLTRIKMKNKGDTIKKGEPIVSIIQNGKQLNLYAPVSGNIIEQNKTLETNSSIINSSPYNDGWIYKIEPTNWARENQLLFMADKFKKYVINDFSRLKDFLAVALNANTDKYAQVILQDGGELKDGTLSDLGPEVWEDFQTKFIDPSRQLWFYEIF